MSSNNGTAQAYDLNYHELCLLIVKAKGIHEGYWRLNIGFLFSATDLALGKTEVRPSVIAQISGVGIVRCAQPPRPDPMIVDAALENSAAGIITSVLDMPRKI